MRALAKFLAKPQMVVDLAVQDDHVAPASRVHRLGASFGEIEDGEAAMTERQSHLEIKPRVARIRATMAQCGGHRFDVILRVTETRLTPETGQAAHVILFREKEVLCSILA